jgi:hypothetical protein
LIKIDIEGAEIEALKGALQLLRKHHPVLIVEFHGLDLAREGIALLGPEGYGFTTQDGHGFDLAAAAGLRRFHESVLCVPSGNPPA